MLVLKSFTKSLKYPFDLSAEVKRHEGDFELTYYLKGALSDLEIPENGGEEPKRMNGLWETTCFEAFLKNASHTNYLEFNFAPSGHWNSFIFSDYREGMKEFSGIKKIHIEKKQSNTELILKCQFSMKRPKGFLESDFHSQKMRMGLSAVLHLKNDQKLYYALNHPMQKPDFHNFESFTHKL